MDASLSACARSDFTAVVRPAPLAHPCKPLRLRQPSIDGPNRILSSRDAVREEGPQESVAVDGGRVCRVSFGAPFTRGGVGASGSCAPSAGTVCARPLGGLRASPALRCCSPRFAGNAVRAPAVRAECLRAGKGAPAFRADEFAAVLLAALWCSCSSHSVHS
jgi:hypothetical protein